MHEAMIERANALINSKKDYIGGGTQGYVVLSLIDENGYPTGSTLSISKADGIQWMSFIGDISGNKERRISKCNKASVCLASSEYNITLVGTMEIITDPAIKKEHWQEVFTNAYGVSWDDPQYCIFRFNTEYYNLFFADDDTEARGALQKL